MKEPRFPLFSKSCKTNITGTSPRCDEGAKSCIPHRTSRSIAESITGRTVITVAGILGGGFFLWQSQSGMSSDTGKHRSLPVPSPSVAVSRDLSGYSSKHNGYATPALLPLQRKGLAKSSSSTSRLAVIRDSYRKGDYKRAAESARDVIHAVAAKPTASPIERKEAARARHLLAFSAARTKDMKEARAQFALLKLEAAALPDKGKPENVTLGESPSPSLLEDAAYQHAVCTAALGDKEGAEREYIAFMQEYPESPLIQASVKRIARLHGGDIPKEAEATWKQAMATAQDLEKKRQREASVCGPECLSELLRRKGETGDEASVKFLAKAAKTTERGVSLHSLATVAKASGWPKAHGVALTAKGLQEQKFPLIALVGSGPTESVRPVGPVGSSGHYVLIDKAGRDKTGKNTVTIWDPDATGVGRSASRTFPATDWEKRWEGGVALVLE